MSSDRAQSLSLSTQEWLRTKRPEQFFGRFITEGICKRLGPDSWQPQDVEMFQEKFREFLENRTLIDTLSQWVVGTIDSSTVVEKHVGGLVSVMAGFLALYLVIGQYRDAPASVEATQ